MNTALSAIVESIARTQDFVIDQAPDVVQQLLAWQFTKSLIFFVFSALLVVAALLPHLSRWAAGRAKAAETDFKEKAAWTRLVPCGQATSEAFDFIVCLPFYVLPARAIVAIAGTIGIFANLGWLQVLVAPKSYVVEYITNII